MRRLYSHFNGCIGGLGRDYLGRRDTRWVAGTDLVYIGPVCTDPAYIDSYRVGSTVVALTYYTDLLDICLVHMDLLVVVVLPAAYCLLVRVAWEFYIRTDRSLLDIGRILCYT